jgi:Putative adhesin
MSKAQSDARYGGWIVICALTALLVPWSLVHAGRAIQERRAVDPQGEIEIVNVSGMVEVDGWDRSEVEVTGTAGDRVDRVDVTSAGNHTSIQVVSRPPRSWGSDCEARLVVHVPAKSAVTVTLVSADFKVTGVLGDVKLQAVSGNLSGEVGGAVRATTVSGDVRLTARAAKAIEIKTISGDIQLTGGGGEVDVTTVSGSATIELADVTRGRFKSVSGDMTAALALVPDGQFESESVSGNLSLKFAAAPAAEFDVQSFSGDIKNCFGPKPVESRYGPGSRLQFTNGEGHAHVRINTKSGDVRLCVKGMSMSHVSALSLAQIRNVRMEVPYVY